MSFHPEALRAMMYVGRITACKVAFGKTEIMDGIEQVCLSYAIASTDPHDTFSELVGLVEIVLELED